MAYNMNDMMRRAGSRSRGIYNPPGPSQSLPNIGQAPQNLGQTPAVQAANAVMGQGMPGSSTTPAAAPTAATPMAGASPAAPPMTPSPSPMAAPAVQPNTFTIHPPGSPSDPSQYNYEPQPDGAWRVYPPGVPAPNHMLQASMPRAASTADYRRMAGAFQQISQQPPA